MSGLKHWQETYAYSGQSANLAPVGGFSPLYCDPTAAIGAVAGPVIGGIMGNNAADTQASAAQSAANQSAQASSDANALQKQMFDQTRADQEPWRQAGVNALSMLGQNTNGPNSMLLRPFGMSDYQQDPGYQFRLGEGLKALQSSAAARGGLLSGGALKGISRYGQDMASQEYQNAYNRFQSNQTNAFNRLGSLAGIGQTANNALQSAGSNYANNSGQIGLNNAVTQGNAALYSGSARASSYQGLGNALGRTDWSKAFGSGQQPTYQQYQNVTQNSPINPLTYSDNYG